MKKLLVFVLVVAMASVANAGLWISVDGQTNPADTTINLVWPSGTAVIDVFSDGDVPSNAEFYLHVAGPGSLSIARAINYVNEGVIFEIEPGLIFMDLAKIGVPIPPVPAGKAVDLMDFHCEGDGDVTLTLYGVYTTGRVDLDTQIIHQIPEPMTIALLGLGSLFALRRRK